jgi:hypothetical protein
LVNTIEIRRGTGVLILARPGVLPLSSRRASDRQQLSIVLAGLARDPGAMAALRAGWSGVFPSGGVMLMTDDGLAERVRSALAARQIEAVLLRDANVPLTPAELTFVQSAIAHVRMQQGQLVIAGKGALPANMRGYLNPQQVVQSLDTMQDFDEGARRLDEQAWILKAYGLGGMRGRSLRTAIAARVRHGTLDAAYVPPGLVGDAATQPLNTGGAVAQMSYADKVGAALQRSVKYLKGEVAAAVEEMVTPTNLAIMAAVFVAVALANTNPVTGAAMDTILIGIAWWSAGLAGIRAIGHFIEATAGALKASNEAELEAAGQVYATALVELGSSLIQALMARFLTKKGGTAEEGAAGGRAAAAKETGKPPAEPPKKPVEPAPTPSIAAAKATLAKRGVPSQTLATLSSREEVGAFTETLNNVDAIDWTKLNQKSGNIFYSGMVGDQPAWKAAAEMAKTKNMNWITDVSGGALDKNRGLIPADAMDWLDTQLSKRLAQNVSGEVTFLGDLNTVATDRIFYKTELPELLKNVNISPGSKAKLLDIKGFLDAKAASSPP